MLVGLSGFENPDVTSLGFLKYSCMPPILKQSFPVKPDNPTDPTSEEPERQENTGQNDEQSNIQVNASVSASLSTLGLILLIVIPTFAVACVVSVVLILRKRSEKVNSNTKTPNPAQTSGTPTLVNPPSGGPPYPNLDSNDTLKPSERLALL